MKIAQRVRDTGGHRRRKEIGGRRNLQIGRLSCDDKRPAAAVVLIDVDQAIGLGDRLVTEQHRVDETENRGVRPDGETEDQHRRRGEPPIVRQAPETVARVAAERFEGGDHFTEYLVNAPPAWVSELGPSAA